MRAATATRRARVIALLAVVALHLLGALLITGTLRAPRTTEPPNPVTVWLAWRGNEQPLEARRRSGATGELRTRSVAPAPKPSSPALAARPPPSPAPPTAAITASPSVDWNGELRAAAASVQKDSQKRGRRTGMGSTPPSPYVSPPARPVFPWSHQPLGKHYDFDSDTGLITVRTKHCVFAIWLILPGFACTPGPVDPEPGEGDLFDHRYAPWTLELPQSLHDLQRAAP